MNMCARPSNNYDCTAFQPSNKQSIGIDSLETVGAQPLLSIVDGLFTIDGGKLFQNAISKLSSNLDV